MKPKINKLFIGLFILLIMLSSCSRPGGSSNGSINGEDIALEDLPPEIQELIAQSEILPDFPLISQLTASPSVVGPGDVVTLNGDPNLYGDVTIIHASETDSLDFSSGSGSYTVSADAPDGIYLISLENDEGAIAFGSFRVASAPGIWLSANGRYVGAEEFIKVTVTAYQVPLDMLAVFPLGFLVQEDIPEDELDFEPPDPFAFDGPSAYLVPTASGELRLGGLLGAPLSEIVDQTFLLPGKFANRIQVFALNPEIAQLLTEGDYEALDAFDEGELPEGFQFLSNIVSIQQCNELGEVSGNLGGSGTARAISLDGELITRSVNTADGSFSILLPAGKAMIEGWREDGTEIVYFPRQVVEVPCGAGVEVSLAAISSPHLARPSLDPFYTIDSQGSGGDEICENIFVNPPVDSSIEYGDANQLISAWAAQIDGGLNRASVASYFDNQELMKQAQQEQLEGGEGQDQQNTASENMGGNILVGSVINQEIDGDRNWIAHLSAIDVSKSKVFARAIISGTSLASLRTLPSSFIEKIKKAAICAKIEPEEKIIGPGEDVNLKIEMTDLNGEAHGNEVKIKLTSKSPACGDLEWTEKSTTALSVTNKYTANDKLSCTDTLEFVGETEGPQGMIESPPQEATAKIIKADLWHFNMTGTLYGDGVSVIDFVWDADFYVDEDGAIKTVIRPEAPDATIGKYTSQNFICRVYENDVLTFQSEHLNPHATWDIELGGTMKVLENGFADIKIAPVGTSWDFDMLPVPEGCGLGILVIDVGLSLVKLLALQPHAFVVEGIFEFGGMTDGPLTIDFPIEDPFSGFVVTITKAPTLVNQP